MNNKGFSFVELLVVMAIMAILMGVGVQSFGLVKHGNIRKSNELVTEQLQTCQKNSKNIYADLYWQMNLINDGGTYTAEIIKLNEKEVPDPAGGTMKIAEPVVVESTELVSGVELSFTCGAYSEKVIEDGRMLSITFHAGSGEVDRVEYDKVENAYQDESKAATAQMNDLFVKGDGKETLRIDINQKGTTYEKNNLIYFNTGKVVSE